MAIFFSNPGIIDVRAVVTIGISAKDGPSIGFFGTGLKYAIAVLLREGQNIIIHAGQDHYHFSKRQDVIRDREFYIVCMKKNSEPAMPLGFTTHLGANWTLENAYREIWSNMMDEKGGFTTGHPGRESTTIQIDGAAFEEVHKNRRNFLFYPSEHQLLSSDANVEVYLGESQQIFYCGIAVLKLHKKSLFTYNILHSMDLTEDRVANPYMVDLHLREFYMNCSNKDLLLSALTADPEKYHEAQIDYDWMQYAMPDSFKEMVQAAIATKPFSVNKAAERLFYRANAGKSVTYPKLPFTEKQQEELDKALRFCYQNGFPIDMPVYLSASLGEHVDALADTQSRIIWLTPKVFEENALRETLIEEFVHIAHNVRDKTRQMQNILFAHIVRLGEALQDNEIILNEVPDETP